MRTRVNALVYGVIFVLVTTAALAIQWPLTGEYDLEAGDVSPADIRAPVAREYISEELTAAARAQADRSVTDVYESQRSVRSDQVRRAWEVLTFVETVRADSLATEDEQIAYLQAIPDVQVTAGDWQLILALDEEGWNRVRDAVPTALNAVMRDEIRDSQIPAARRRVPGFIDLEDEEEAQAAILLVQALIRPNMFYNAERTEAVRQEARAAVPPQTVSYEQDEIIVRQGDILKPIHVEALEEFGLTQPQWDWWDLVEAFLLALLLAFVFGLYFWRTGSFTVVKQRRHGLLLALLATFLLIAKLMIPDHTLLPYIFPMAALTMLILPVLGISTTFLVTIYFTVVVANLTDGEVAILVYLTVGPLIGALILGKAERTSRFVAAGAVVAVVNIIVLAIFNLPSGDYDLGGYLQLLAAAVVNGGLAASVTLIGFYLLGAIFDLATPLRLMELARPNHPLLSELIMKTPGTYHHSLLVSNLTEQAAEAIGADAFLCRVGSYYHDIGKLARPYFFVENRIEGVDPHEQLDPWSSAQIIISHIKDGLELARKHKLPKRIQDFIAEHQGTGLVRFFYHEAQKVATEGEVVDERDFRYPGPRPQSKETAILMLADSCESAVRAAHPDSKEEIDEIVRRIINQKLIEGELSDSDLTLRDLEAIRDTFVRSLQGVHHPRVKYPEPVTTRLQPPGSGEPSLAPREGVA